MKLFDVLFCFPHPSRKEKEFPTERADRALPFGCFWYASPGRDGGFCYSERPSLLNRRQGRGRRGRERKKGRGEDNRAKAPVKNHRLTAEFSSSASHEKLGVFDSDRGGKGKKEKGEKKPGFARRGCNETLAVTISVLTAVVTAKAALHIKQRASQKEKRREKSSPPERAKMLAHLLAARPTSCPGLQAPNTPGGDSGTRKKGKKRHCGNLRR